MLSVSTDFRHAIRGLARTPLFTVVVVLTLALGIGATTAIFTLTEALLWRPLPVRDPARLARIERIDRQGRELGLSSELVSLIRDERLFNGFCAFMTPYTTLTLNGRVAQRATHAMTSDCFATLGLQPAIGRLFSSDDERVGMPYVAVLTYAAWLREYGGRADVIGTTLEITGTPFTIIGVAESRFDGLLLGFPPQVLFPIAQTASTSAVRAPGTFTSAMVLGRLPDSQGLADAGAQLEARWPSLRAASLAPDVSGLPRDAYLDSRVRLTSAESGVDYVLRDRFGRPVVALAALAAIVLLVSLVNVASLLLARAAERRTVLAVRLALGAGRWRIAREAAAESLLLILAGAGAGIAIAYAGDQLLVSMLRLSYEDFAMDVTPNARVLWLTATISVATLVAFAMIPAWRAGAIDASVLATASPRVIGDRHRAQHASVVAQIALTLTLVSVGGLTAERVSDLRRSPLGFAPERVMAAKLALLPANFAAELEPTYQHTLLNRLAGFPGVESVALSSTTPLFTVASIEPVSPLGAPDRQVSAEQHTVTDRFFETMQIPLLAGSRFGANDRATDQRRTVIVSASLAERLFGARDPIGQRVRVGTRADLQSLEIIGIARDAVLASPQAQNTLAVYRNYWQAPAAYRRWSSLILRANGEPTLLAAAVRRALDEGGREYAASMRTLSEQHDAALAQERLVASLAAIFAVLGLLVAGVGVYGLFSLSVAQRTHEMAMRLALGATPSQLRRLVLRHVVALTSVAAAVGLPIAWGAQQAVAKLLAGGVAPLVTPLIAALGSIVIVATVASWFPARRASTVDPMVALRSE